MQILIVKVVKVAEVASAALAQGDQFLAAFTSYLQARQASREVGAQPVA